MRWKDKAILLTVRRTDQKTLLIEVFTANHGRQTGTLKLDEAEVPPLPPGCWIEIELARPDGQPDAIGELTILNVSGGVAASKKSDVGFLVLTSIKVLLSRLLPERQPLHELFDATTTLIDSLSNEDGRWPVEYARWEMSLLDTLGHVEGLKRCLPDFRQGEAIYISPVSGKMVTRVEAGAFLDRLIQVPGFLMGNREPDIREVRDGFHMTRLMLERMAFPSAGMTEMPSARNELAVHVASIPKLPKATRAPLGMENEEKRRRRMSEIANPLMVGTRS